MNKHLVCFTIVIAFILQGCAFNSDGKEHLMPDGVTIKYETYTERINPVGPQWSKGGTYWYRIVGHDAKGNPIKVPCAPPREYDSIGGVNSGIGYDVLPAAILGGSNVAAEAVHRPDEFKYNSSTTTIQKGAGSGPVDIDSANANNSSADPQLSSSVTANPQSNSSATAKPSVSNKVGASANASPHITNKAGASAGAKADSNSKSNSSARNSNQNSAKGGNSNAENNNSNTAKGGTGYGGDANSNAENSNRNSNEAKGVGNGYGGDTKIDNNNSPHKKWGGKVVD